ncbi:MAG: PfkB family carbohydrate kinase [Mangrovibacterium sp.]
MKKEQLQKILEDISNVRIVVLGDFCLDAYWFTDESKSEISIETGLATRPVKQQKYSSGGAGNVTSNLAAMGVKDVRAIGVTGPDPFSRELVSILSRNGINTDNILQQDEQWYTHVYIKPYVDSQEQSRIDFGNFNQLSDATADRLAEILDNQADEVDVIIINQQVVSGIHTKYLRNRIVEVIARHPEKIFIVDSRDFSDYYAGAYRKMNDREASRLCGIEHDPDEPIPYTEILDSAKLLYKRYQKPLFITRGSKGSLIVDESGISEILGLMITSRIDPVGAGDSYLAGAASALGAGYPMTVAAEIGSLVAGVTIQKLFQTGTASPEEILLLGQEAGYVYSPELAENIRMARYVPDTEIEIIHEWKDQFKIRHAIFDHDGTLSTLREGWELIMAPMMIRAVLGDHYQEADETLYRKVEARVNEYIDTTTGIQTLVQMKGLLDMIREFGIVPEDQMLDEFGYKHIYNEELLKMVKEREKKLNRGELTREDFSLKNAIPFLQKLYDTGIKLYLASGTDEEDVKNEARIMGYDHLFEGRIYGAVGDITKEAKKMVLDRILDSIGEAAFGEVITFGDGPVEIRETRKRGGMTIGVASHELRRFGLNERKRTRLIKAGADLIIPDFSQMQPLLNLLNI